MTSSIECKNFLKSLQLLSSFVNIGVEYFILCPGSRSAPLALAANELFSQRKIQLFNSIDERSAGFHALGISSASGKNVIVITTSGTAVANLLPSAIEADRSCINILYLTADRPYRLKECGANQTVNQEEFLLSACKAYLNTNLEGLHEESESDIRNLTKSILKENTINPGPIHLNIPFEKPLMLSFEKKKKMLEVFHQGQLKNNFNLISNQINYINGRKIKKTIDLKKTGLIIVGPYRGSTNNLSEFNKSLELLQNISGWPVFADPISGVKKTLRGLVENWELVILRNKKLLNFEQLLRLGPMPSSIVLEEFLKVFKGFHFLIKEGDSRKLDPFRKAVEYEFGLNEFMKCTLEQKYKRNVANSSLIPIADKLILEGKRIKTLIKNEVLINDKITEVSIANLVPKIWPKNYPIMISASSPIRDWITFSGNNVLTRRCFSFRGASGIDGTLSMALGIARVMNPLLLITGDLSFLHDINGWLIEDAKKINLKILLLDNNGGNIFNRLYKNNLTKVEIEKLFLMKQVISWNKLAETHKIPYINIFSLNKLKEAFEWSLSIQKSVIIKVDIDLDYEFKQRENIYKNIFKNQ